MMKNLAYTILFLFVEGGIFIGLLFLPPQTGWLLIVSGVSVAVAFFCRILKKKVVKNAKIKIAGLEWSINDFCRGVLVTGQTGSGKTASAIRQILYSLFRGVPSFGALVVDEKGQFYEAVAGVAKHFRKQGKIILLRVASGRTPQQTYNPLSYPGISWKNYSSLILDTAQSIGVRLESFWWESARDLFEAVLTIIAANRQPTLADLYYTVTSKEQLQKLAMTYDGNAPNAQVEHSCAKLSAFLRDTPAQRDGVLGSCRTIVNTFSTPEVQAVFCAGNSLDFRDMDQGKIFCVSLTEEFAHERRFFNTFFKLLFYTHARYRFNDSRTLAQKNLIVFLADEAQQIVTSSEANSDYDAVAVMREAKATCVFATQAITSLTTKLKPEGVKTLILNMATQFCFTAGDQDTAETLSRSLGVKVTTIETKSGDSKEEEKPRFSPADLRALRKFQCVIKHPDGTTKKLFLPPLDDRGKRPLYYYQERFWVFGHLFYWLQF